MDRAADRALAAIARAQYGVFSLAQARAAGINEHVRDHRIATGQWIVVHDQVFRLAGVPTTWKGDLLAACWAGGFRAAASHRSAAALWRLPGGRWQFTEIVCPRWRRARHEGLIVHETKAIEDVDLTVIDRIPVTAIERTLIDLAAVCHESVVELAVSEAEGRELTTVAAVREALDRLARQGRNGVGRLRRVLDHRWDECWTESVAETRLLQVLRWHGLPAPITQYEVRHEGKFIARVDAAYPEWKVAIEYDSEKHHAGRVKVGRDNDRRLEVTGAGYTPVTVTKHALRARRGKAVVDAILAARRPAP